MPVALSDGYNSHQGGSTARRKYFYVPNGTTEFAIDNAVHEARQKS